MHRNHNKKEFQSNYNRPLTDRTGYILNKFAHVGGGGSLAVRTQLNKSSFSVLCK